MKKSVVFLCFTLFAVVMTFAVARAEWKPEVKYITVYNGTLGGGWHPIAALTAEIIHEAIPEIITTPGPGGGVANAKVVETGKGEMGMCMTGTQYEAWQGLAPFEKPYKNIRHLISLYIFPHVWIVRKDSDIKSFEQLKDKRISTGKPGQTTFTMGQSLLKMFGITFEGIRANGGVVSNLGDGERVNMLVDKNLDAISLMAPLNHANFLSMKMRPGIRLLSMNKDKLDKYIQENPGTIVYNIPKKTFDKDQEEDIQTVATVTTLVCRAGLSDELIYRITKAIIEKQSKYLQYIPAQDLILSKPLSGNMIPVHSGAERYYRERGFLK
jgi:uncharacterized protein